MMRYMGTAEVCRFLNHEDVPGYRHIYPGVVALWVDNGYVRAITGENGRRKVNVYDVIPCVIARLAGKPGSGKQLHVARVHRPAAYTDPGRVRALHDQMTAQGFPPLLEFDAFSDPSEEPLAETVRKLRAKGVSERKFAKRYRLSRSTITRMNSRKMRYA